MQSLKESFKRGVSWNAVSVFGNAATHAIGSLVIAYFMSPEDFFLIGVLLMLMNQAFVVSEFGLATAIVQAKDLRSYHLNTIFIINLIIGTILTSLFCALSPLAAWYFKSPILIPIMLLTSVIFFILSTGLVHKAKLARDVNFKALSMAEIAGYVVYLFMLSLLGWMGKGVWAFVWAKVGQQSIETIVMWIAGRFAPDFRDLSFRETKPMLHFGINMSGAQVVAFLIGNLDVLLVGRFFPKTAGGYYLFSRQVVLVPAVRFLKLLTRVSVSILSRMQDDLPRMARSFCLMNKFLAILALPAFLGLSAACFEIIHAVLPAKWHPIVELVRIQSLSILAHLFAALTIVVYYALARAEVLMRFQLIVLAFRAILLGAVTYFTRDVIYMAYALLFERLFFTVFFENLAFSLMGQKASQLLRHLIHPLIASFLMVIFVVAISYAGSFLEYSRLHIWMVLITQVFIGGVAYFAYIAMRDRHIMNEVKNMKFTRKKTELSDTPLSGSPEALS